MSNRVKGTILGIITSLLGVVLFAIFYAFLDSIAGVAAVLMGGAFLFVYRKINPEDESMYPIIMAIVLTLIEVVLGWLLGFVIWCAYEGVDFTLTITAPKNTRNIILQIVIGYVLGGFALGIILFAEKKQREMKKIKNSSAYYTQYKEEDNKLDNKEIETKQDEEKKEEEKNNEERL